MEKETTPYYLIQSVDRTLRVLQLFIAHRKPLGVTELAKELSLHKSVVHRLLLTLQHHGYVEKMQDTDHYKIGPRAFELGAVYSGATNLIDEGKKILMQIVADLGTTAHLAILDQETVLYLVNIEPDHLKYIFGVVGQRKPIYTTALGKSLTAWLPKETIMALLQACLFEQRTATTIRSLDAFQTELATVRLQGYAIDNEESVVGMRCASAPIRDQSGQVIAAISLSGYNISLTQIQKFGLKLKGYAAQLSRRMGYFENV